MSQQHKDPVPVPGVHLVKTTSREEDALASDCVDILQDGLRGSTDTDTGGVEETYLTTLEQEEAKRTEVMFFNAIAEKVKNRCPWASPTHGLHILETGDRKGWRFGVKDREGRHFEVEITFHQIFEIRQQQRNATLGSFNGTLNRIVDALEEKRRTYFARRDGVNLQ